MDVEKEDIFQSLSSSDLASVFNSIDSPLALADKSGKICWFSDNFRERFPRVQSNSSIESILDLSDDFKSLVIPCTIELDKFIISVSKLNNHYNLITVRDKYSHCKIQTIILLIATKFTKRMNNLYFLFIRSPVKNLSHTSNQLI